MGVTILAIDDHPLIHDVLRVIVQAAAPDAKVCCERDLAPGILRAQAEEHLCLILLDLGLPGCVGMDALTRLRKSVPEVRVAIVSANTEGDTVRAALRSGASGYLPKTLTPKAMVAALRVILEGGIYVPLEALVDVSLENERMRAPPDCLTDRQDQILRLLACGISNREIARQLGIAESTVKQHTHAIYKALGVGNRTEAAIAAAQRRIHTA